MDFFIFTTVKDGIILQNRKNTRKVLHFGYKDFIKTVKMGSGTKYRFPYASCSVFSVWIPPRTA